MLIQITNRCYMQCPHCMQDSNPRGKHMEDETFEQVLDLIKESQSLLVSITGGEPTEHPAWRDYANAILAIPSVKVLSITTNGSWIEDGNTRVGVARLIRENKNRVKVQVYSNRKYYRDHEWTVCHGPQFRSIGCITDFDSPIIMQDLGRARKNCRQEVAASDHVPSCINSHLFAMQARNFNHFLLMAIQAGKFCRPLIDPDGNIHMSESWLCPSVAHVGDGMEEIFRKMRTSRPCQECQLYKNFEELHKEEMKILKR